MSSSKAEVKRLLKRAKQCLQDSEYEDCLDETKDILELDRDNYFAYVFRAKAFQSLKKLPTAVLAFRRAIEINSEDLLAWKGLYLLYKDDENFDDFFNFLQEYVVVVKGDQTELNKIVKDINIYNKKFNKHFSNEKSMEIYLRAILPSTPLGRDVGLQFQPYEKTIEDLLKLVDAQESKSVKEVKRRYPLNPTPLEQLKLNSSLYKIYSKSEIPYLYHLMINSVQDDSKRHYYEDLSLVYDYNVIKVSPTEQEKLDQMAVLLDEVQGMITIRHPSQQAWFLYFDFICSNLNSLNFLNLDELCWYVCNFTRDKGLAQIIQGFLYSEISPFDLKMVDQKMKEYQIQDSKKSSTDDLNADDELDVLENFEDQKSAGLTPDEITTLLNDGIENSNDSLFGSRIVISYYIHVKEYLAASDRTRRAVRALTRITNATAIRLPIYKRFLFLSLATIYTYFEAPKNFGKALELYNRIEQEDPDDVTVKIGKSFILIEKGDIETAKGLLREAVKVSRDVDAQVELGWCQIQSNEVDQGRQLLKHILDQDVITSQKKAIILWRLAESYLMELVSESTTEKDVVIKTAFDYIILSLKQSKSYAPSYTSLGLIYNNYYNDHLKAIKCFYKAFELDNSNLNAAKELVTHYAELQEWPMCQILCERLISDENAKRQLTLSKIPGNSWPYRILGICHLELQEDAKSVEYFQNAIRLDSQDISSWCCLGESYYACGRLEAALKVFDHCLKLTYNKDAVLSVERCHILYMLASVHSSLGNFSEAIENLQVLLNQKDVEEISFVKLYCQTLSNQLLDYIENGFTGRGIATCLEVIDLIYENEKMEEFMQSQTVWKHLADILLVFLYFQESQEKFPVDKVQEIVDQIPPLNEFLASLDFTSLDAKSDQTQLILSLLIKCSMNAIEVVTTRSPRELRASLFYNLGTNCVHAYLLSAEKSLTLLKNAIQVYQKVLQLHDREALYWVGLGVASFLNSDAPDAQHCLIKALALAPRDPTIWSDLALLYMKYDDISLSQEAFSKIQALAPQSNVGWLGNALINEVTGNKEEAWKYFTHAYVLSKGRSLTAQLLYSHSIVQKRVGAGVDQRDLDAIQELTVANFAISDYLRRFPNETFAVQMALLIIEKLGDYDKAITLAEQLASTLESLFETSEDDKILLGFARVKSTLGRLYLGIGDYEQALSSAQFALDVSEENIDEQNEDLMKIVLSSRVVIGLAYLFTNNFDGALEQLKLILVHQQSNESSKQTKENLFVLVSQILYAKGTEDSVQAAIDELFTYIEENGSSLLVALTLGSIALVENLEDILPAIHSDLLNLKLPDLINDRFRQIPIFIQQINERLQIDGSKYDQRTAFMFPNDIKVWENLNSSMSLAIGSISGQVSSDKLSETLVKCGKIRQIQRGLFLNPNNIDGYKALKGCLTTPN